MGIVVSQIEIERIFNMVGVITSLRHCWLGIKNLDKFVFIMKNWLDDPKFGCATSLPNSIEEYLKIENDMISKNEDFIVNFNLFEEN